MDSKHQVMLSLLINRKRPRFNWSSIFLSRSTTAQQIHKYHPPLLQHFHQWGIIILRTRTLFLHKTLLPGVGGHQTAWKKFLGQKETALNWNATLVCSMEETLFFDLPPPFDMWQIAILNQRHTSSLDSTPSPWRPCLAGWPASSSSSSLSASSFSFF